MPIAFPSHQGLLAPLWRLWPQSFSVLGLWVGAAVPDLIDGCENILVRGHFHQWIGHSLIGASVAGVPVGLALTWLVRRVTNRWACGPTETVWQRIGTWLGRVDNAARTPASIARLRQEASSVWIGAVSHVLLDMLTHERSRLLWPLAPDPAWLGAWWHSAWFHVSAPGYPDYPIGPHFVAWLVLSIGGAAMFFRWPPRRMPPHRTG